MCDCRDEAIGKEAVALFLQAASNRLLARMATWQLITTTHALKFLFETITDLAFVPALYVVAARARHFELFIGLLLCLSIKWKCL